MPTGEPTDSDKPKSAVLRWLLQFRDAPWGRDLSLFDAHAVAQTVERLKRLGRYLPWFQIETSGFDYIPDPPVLVVMNHSGGTSIPDVWGMLYAWYRHFGTSRPIRPLAHELVVGQRLTGGYFSRRGILLADSQLAYEALAEHGQDVFVCPGGDIEAWRPYSERYQLKFDGRMGYAKVALRAGVPIVPVAHAGAHETFIVLWQGRRLARALRLHEYFRAEIFPIHVSLPWGLFVGPVPHIPWPARLRYVADQALRLPDANGPIVSPSDEQVRGLDARVRVSIQRGLDRLKMESGG